SNNTDAAISDKFMAQVEQAIFNKVNEERTKAGIAPLTYNTTMEKYARIKSQDMGDNNYFSHTDLNGNNITTKMKADGVTYNAWGENIAYIGGVTDPTALANQFMTNWMNSQGHKENILSTKFSSIGVGVYKIGNKLYGTQEFYR
ncbi:MAG: CAP domain-containing protein, partial [Clostridium sp.]|nr:CAP domain-containing protein [Clostridium sp.]